MGDTDGEMVDWEQKSMVYTQREVRERTSSSYRWRTSKLAVDYTCEIISSMGRSGFTCDGFSYDNGFSLQRGGEEAELRWD